MFLKCLIKTKLMEIIMEDTFKQYFLKQTNLFIYLCMYVCIY